MRNSLSLTIQYGFSRFNRQWQNGNANVTLGNSHFERGSAFVAVDHGFMPTPLESLVVPAEMVAETRLGECTHLASQWISTCHESHPACQQQQLSRLPTRVIDVGSYQRHPRLLECDGKADRYIALSHCWGSGRHFTTETTNLKERMKGMRWELESLPKTFQDVISITRKLGIRNQCCR